MLALRDVLHVGAKENVSASDLLAGRIVSHSEGFILKSVEATVLLLLSVSRRRLFSFPHFIFTFSVVVGEENDIPKSYPLLSYASSTASRTFYGAAESSRFLCRQKHVSFRRSSSLLCHVLSATAHSADFTLIQRQE